jgi:hypothetical protein
LADLAATGVVIEPDSVEFLDAEELLIRQRDELAKQGIHPYLELHNVVELLLDTATQTVFTAVVGAVVGWAGAKLRPGGNEKSTIVQIIGPNGQVLETVEINRRGGSRTSPPSIEKFTAQRDFFDTASGT